MQESRTAILLFTNTAEAEIQTKQFVNSNNRIKNRVIAEHLINESIKKVSSLNTPYFIVSTSDQIGASFGEKLSNAIQFVFEKGFKKVLVTGSDIPTLGRNALANATKKLEHNDFVIGPTSKGGTYLIGISEKLFNKVQFENLRWQTRDLLSDLINYTNSQSKQLAIERTLFDINTQYDLVRFVVNFSRRTKIARLISALISTFKLTQVFSCCKMQLATPRYFFGLVAPPLK